MGIFDRLFGKRGASEPPPPRARAGEAAVEIDRSTAGPGPKLFYHFICSESEGVVKTCHEAFRAESASYGGSAACYSASCDRLVNRSAEASAASLPFSGKRIMGSHITDAESVSDVLIGLSLPAFTGRVFISSVTVSAVGQVWVAQIHQALIRTAVRTGVLPPSMYTTASEDAARFLVDSFEPMPER